MANDTKLVVLVVACKKLIKSSVSEITKKTKNRTPFKSMRDRHTIETFNASG